MQIGDKAQWVPSVDHEFDPVGEGFAWEHEILDLPTGKWKPASPFLVLNAVEIIRRDKSRRKELRATKPACTYPATVAGVELGGTMSLDIKSPIGGVTLHYSGVVVDPTGKPGTCREAV